MDRHGFGERIRQAVLDHASQIRRQYSFAELGREVGTLERGKPYSSSAVGEWLAERNEPTLSTFKAIAKVTGKPVAWLMALDLEDAQAEPSTGVEELVAEAEPPPPVVAPAKARGRGGK